ncbi:hypothetical protein [Desulfosporosinus hippei]|uniref:Uncharacterized protein n=1 Tax=Desulfosporosinus hippei DSM 8344 TaxID=1121419 RepID=A0A1G7Z3Q3_9FIRM|nr:hypothetical protein [Desulfosporosinus hippei]SDH03402.1 hypothetical protein SAMN05443529_1091 [Desulfosporosinus hippei DSM 8344]
MITNDNSPLNHTITSLHCYHNSLFVAYLNGKIEIIPLYKNFSGYFSRLTPFNIDNLNNDSIIIDMQTYRETLFTSTHQFLFSFDLRNNNQPQQVFEKRIPFCTKIKINHKRRLLFALSETRGLVVLNIFNPNSPQYLTDIENKIIDKNGHSYVTDIDVNDNTIFLALRSKGIVRIDFLQNEFSVPSVYKQIKKISLTEPQEIKYSSLTKLLYIIDASEGLILLNTSNNEVLFSKRLPQNDMPRKIILHYKDAVIQGRKGVYYFNFKEETLKMIFNFKIGTMTKYHKQLVYSKQNSLNLLVLGKLDEPKKTELIDSSARFTRIDNYFNNELTPLK